MTKPSSGQAMGRPRGFDTQAALEAALLVFWRHGYAATSLDELTSAMGISRSSFYGAFVSKHDVLLAATGQYMDGIFARLQALAGTGDAPAAALRAVLREMAMPHGGRDGCLLVNAIAELASDDRDVRGIARMHVSRLLALVGGLLVQAGHRRDTAGPLAGTLLSCVFGAMTLRRAGVPAGQVAAFMAEAERLLAPPQDDGMTRRGRKAFQPP